MKASRETLKGPASNLLERVQNSLGFPIKDCLRMDMDDCFAEQRTLVITPSHFMVLSSKVVNKLLDHYLLWLYMMGNQSDTTHLGFHETKQRLELLLMAKPCHGICVR